MSLQIDCCLVQECFPEMAFSMQMQLCPCSVFKDSSSAGVSELMGFIFEINILPFRLQNVRAMMDF